MEQMVKGTYVYKVDPEKPDPNKIAACAWLLKTGKTVAFPTETVYGLGADALCPEAVAGIFAAKGRPSDNPLIVHVAKREDCELLAEPVSARARRLMEIFWPGPLTLVLPRRKGVSPLVTAGLDTVALRMPDHKVALALIQEAKMPIAAPSANVSGRPSPTCAAHVLKDMAGRIGAVLDGGETGIGLESTVLDVTRKVPVILRPGGITRLDIEAVVGEVKVEKTQEDEAIFLPRSPGMKYRHYAPEADMLVVEGNPNRTAEEIIKEAKAASAAGKKVVVLAPKEHLFRYEGFWAVSMGQEKKPETIARRLYKLLREMDDLRVDLILAQGIDSSGIGAAIMNRLRKASGFSIRRV